MAQSKIQKGLEAKAVIQIWLKDHEIVDKEGKPEPIYVDTSKFTEKPCPRCGRMTPHYQILIRGNVVGEHVFPHKEE